MYHINNQIYAPAYPEIMSLAIFRGLPITRNNFNWTKNSELPLEYNSINITKTRKPHFKNAILPGVPSSSMFGAESALRIEQLYKDLFAEFGVKPAGNYKNFVMQKSKRKLLRRYPEIMQILKQYGLEHIPELYIHISKSLNIFKFLAEKNSIAITKDDVELLLLHDISKPYSLIYNHWLETKMLIARYGKSEVKKMILSGKIDSRLLWKFSKQIVEDEKEIVPPIPFDDFPKDVLNKDRDLLSWMLDRNKITGLSKTSLERLKEFNKNEFSSRINSLIKLSELVSDYEQIVYMENVEEALKLKTHAVSKRYGVPVGKIEKKYKRLLKKINEK